MPRPGSCLEGTAKLKQSLCPKDPNCGGSREGLCSQTGFLIQFSVQVSTSFSALRGKITSMHGTNTHDGKRPSFAGELEIGEVAQGRTLLFRLSAVGLVLPKLLST